MSDDFLKISDFSSTYRAVLSCEPAAFLINKGTQKLWENHRIAARFLSSLQYFTNPVDRLIQAFAAPIFSTVSFVCATHAAYGKDDEEGEGGRLEGFSYLGRRAIVFMPCVAQETICLWIPLAANTAIHLLPFIAISACKDNRPHNFFWRREYTGAANDWPLTFSLLMSDKDSAQALYHELLEDVYDQYSGGLSLEALALVNYEERVKEYESLPRRDGVEKLINNLHSSDESQRPIDSGAHRKQVDTGVFFDEMKKLFLAYFPRRGRYPVVNPMISYLESCGGVGFVFLLKEEPPLEVRRRFGIVLEWLEESSKLNALRDRILEHSEQTKIIQSWLLELEATFAYVYENLINAGAPAIKSARTKFH